MEPSRREFKIPPLRVLCFLSDATERKCPSGMRTKLLKPQMTFKRKINSIYLNDHGYYPIITQTCQLAFLTFSISVKKFINTLCRGLCHAGRGNKFLHVRIFNCRNRSKIL